MAEEPKRRKDPKGRKDPGKHERRRVFHALNKELRRELLRLLHATPRKLSPVEASGLLDIPLSTVSYHANILRSCGSIELVDERQVRGAVEHFFQSRHEDDKPVRELLDETRQEDEGLLREMREKRKPRKKRKRKRQG